MKSIVLHGPAARNDGSYSDAGAELTVGAEPDQISAERLKPLLRGRRAVRQAARG